MELISYSNRCAIVIDLTKRLRTRGSWCGETHVQKAIYILQDLLKSNLGYKFVIYKHGPYSFELNSEVSSMKASNILDFVFPREGYGPTIVATAFGERVYEVNRGNIEQFMRANDFLADWFAASDVKYLEKLATAYYVTKKHPREAVAERAKRINALKPHVDVRAAEEAIKIVDQKREEARRHLAVAMT